MKTPKLKTVVVKAPGQAPIATQVAAIDLALLQNTVCGYVQAVPMAGTSLTVWCNEEGKLAGLAGNVFMGADVVMGTVIVTGGCTPAGNTRGLTPKQAEQAIARLWQLAC